MPYRSFTTKDGKWGKCWVTEEEEEEEEEEKEEAGRDFSRERKRKLSQKLQRLYESSTSADPSSSAPSLRKQKFVSIRVNFVLKSTDSKEFEESIRQKIEESGPCHCEILSVKSELGTCVVQFKTDLLFENQKAIKTKLQEIFPNVLVVFADAGCNTRSCTFKTPDSYCYIRGYFCSSLEKAKVQVQSFC